MQQRITIYRFVIYKSIFIWKAIRISKMCIYIIVYEKYNQNAMEVGHLDEKYIR